jgi:formate hydrogenlyase subunit 3/multisubunit Na+/H+ antiporter MnhD subunit
VQVLERGIDGTGAPYAYGFAIVLLTVLVKAATFPLTQKQVRIPTWDPNRHAGSSSSVSGLQSGSSIID